jgi:hypothetical protein
LFLLDTGDRVGIIDTRLGVLAMSTAYATAEGGGIAMKIHSIVGLILLSILIGPVTGMAQTTVINDLRDGANTYYGGTAVPSPSNYANQDVIPGSTLEWDINSMVVTVTGTTVDVKVIGPWFSPVYNSADLFYNSGDLYLSSTGWKHTTDSPHFITDTFTQAEGWNFVVTDRKPAYNQAGGFTGYESGVYVLDWNTLKMTDPTYALALGRADQAYHDGYGGKVEGATVTFNNTLGANSYMEFQFNNFLSGDVGLHWTMYCGNDVVEGQVTFVPEPGSLLLLGFGLAGLGVYRRRWLRK